MLKGIAVELLGVQRKSTVTPWPDVVADTRPGRVVEAASGETFPAYRQVRRFQRDPRPSRGKAARGKCRHPDPRTMGGPQQTRSET